MPRSTRRRFHDAPRPSIPEPRSALLQAVLAFVDRAAACPGVTRIALTGSLTTSKLVPKDVDVLLTLADAEMDLAKLAAACRRLKGEAQQINLGADIFLADEACRYIGRICGYRECHHRALCQACLCGFRQHLNDDLHVITLASAAIATPPCILWPRIQRHAPLPTDVETILLAPLAKRQGGECVPPVAD